MAKSTIQLEKLTIERLAKFGDFHSTYESIIISLLEHAEKCALMKKGK